MSCRRCGICCRKVTFSCHADRKRGSLVLRAEPGVERDVIRCWQMTCRPLTRLRTIKEPSKDPKLAIAQAVYRCADVRLLRDGRVGCPWQHIKSFICTQFKCNGLM